MSRKHRFQSPALEHLYRRYIGDSAEQQEAFEEELANAQAARAIYDLRSKEKLTQAALARLLGTTPSVISRLESANYEGHSLAMLRRIARVLNRRLEIRFIRPRRRLLASKKMAVKKGTVRRKTGTR